MEDFEIVNLFWDKDEQAITETKNKYDNYCHSIAFNILHNSQDCEEVLNDTYLGVWNAIPPHRPNVLSTFIGKICRRLSLNKLRSLNAQKRGGNQIIVSFDELEQCIADNSFSDQLQTQILAETINDFLSTLKENERKVFVCRYWYFDSIDNIAKRFSYGQSKVKMMLKRTRDKLRDYLIKEGVLR